MNVEVRIRGPERDIQPERMSGIKDLAFFSRDNAGNEERWSPPKWRSTASRNRIDACGGEQYSQDQKTYASTDAAFSFSAIDRGRCAWRPGYAALFDGRLALRFAFGLAFNLAEGSHSIIFQSRDNVENLRNPRSTSVYVDATAPVIVMGFRGFRESFGALR